MMTDTENELFEILLKIEALWDIAFDVIDYLTLDVCTLDPHYIEIETSGDLLEVAHLKAKLRQLYDDIRTLRDRDSR